MVGAYSINNVMYDLVTCVCFGFIGYLMMRYDYPVSPMVLAQILGAMMESNFRRSLVMSSGDPLILVTRPIALIILILAAFATVTALRRQRKSQQVQAAMETPT
jgi:putative tricarboxylic transport membrane protein